MLLKEDNSTTALQMSTTKLNANTHDMNNLKIFSINFFHICDYTIETRVSKCIMVLYGVNVK